MMNIEDIDIDALFMNAEVVEIIQQEYFDGVERAILGDEEAFMVISASMDMMRSSGEFARLQNMTEFLGRMACDHQHLQEFSRDISEKYSLDSDNANKNRAEHVDEDEDDDEEDKEYKWVKGRRVMLRKNN